MRDGDGNDIDMHTERLIEALSLTFVVALAGGCTGDTDARESSSGSGINTVSDSNGTGGTDSNSGGTADTGSSNSESNSGTSATTDSATSGSSGPPKFDLGEQPDANVDMEEGCTKVDFLFVIDNSGSMNDEQANLIANFPTFITGIESTLAQVDEYHVGVVTTDAYSYNVAGCNSIGGMVVKTGGSNSSNQMCGPYAAGNNYMTEADNLSQTFSCAAQVGTSGSSQERPMDALVSVVNKNLEGAGQCNEGFMRDDALLVTVIITDEWDGPNDPELQGSSGTPQDWYDAVVAGKVGIPENAVILSLINYAGGPCPPTSPAYDGVHIATFTQLFGMNGFLGGVCENDYGPIFQEAIGIIEEACNNFQPPG